MQRRLKRAIIRATAPLTDINKRTPFSPSPKAYMKQGGTVEGLGGGGGVGVIGGALALLAVLVVAVSRSSGPESLGQVAAGLEGESLTAIAGRMQKGL